jgi:hypothetical protein
MDKRCEKMQRLNRLIFVLRSYFLRLGDCFLSFHRHFVKTQHSSLASSKA